MVIVVVVVESRECGNQNFLWLKCEIWELVELTDFMEY